MPPLLFAYLSPWPYRVDRGVLLLVAALFLASILAHRYWRAVIRLEDEGEARRLDAERSLERYRTAFRALPYPAAFVDRATGLVMEAAPGWVKEGLPGAGVEVFAGDPELEAVWRSIPPPDAQHRAAAPLEVALRGRAFRAEPLGGASLGTVLVVSA